MKALLFTLRLVSGFAALIMVLSLLAWVINSLLKVFGPAGLVLPILGWGAVEYSQLDDKAKAELKALAKSKLPDWDVKPESKK
jgi:hypothetical protein